MNHPATTFLYAVLAGIALAAGLELVVHGLWDSYYSQHPVRGYEGAMAAGLVAPALYNSAMALLHGALAFLLAGLVVMLPSRGRAPVALAFAGAALVTLSAFAFARPEVRGSNLGPLTPLFLSIYFGPPFALGMALGGAVGWWRRRGDHARHD